MKFESIWLRLQFSVGASDFSGANCAQYWCIVISDAGRDIVGDD